MKQSACMREICISRIETIKQRIARICRTGARGSRPAFVRLWRDFYLWACAPVAWGTSGHPSPVPRHCEMAQNAVANGGAQIDFKALATNVQGFDHALDYVTVNKTASVVRSTPYAEWRAVPAAGQAPAMLVRRHRYCCLLMHRSPLQPAAVHASVARAALAGACWPA